MRRLAKYTLPDYSPGTTRLKRVFAFLPTRVGEYIIWLEFYIVLQTYLLLDYKVKIDDKDKAFRVGEWKDISKRLSDG